MSKYPQFPVIDDESFDLLFHTIVTHMGFYDKEFIILQFAALIVVPCAHLQHI